MYERVICLFCGAGVVVCMRVHRCGCVTEQACPEDAHPWPHFMAQTFARTASAPQLRGGGGGGGGSGDALGLPAALGGLFGGALPTLLLSMGGGGPFVSRDELQTLLLNQSAQVVVRGVGLRLGGGLFLGDASHPPYFLVWWFAGQGRIAWPPGKEPQWTPASAQDIRCVTHDTAVAHTGTFCSGESAPKTSQTPPLEDLSGKGDLLAADLIWCSIG